METITPDPDYQGEVMVDDNILAIDVSETQDDAGTIRGMIAVISEAFDNVLGADAKILPRTRTALASRSTRYPRLRLSWRRTLNASAKSIETVGFACKW
jgi:hypothetical protein